MSTHAHFHKKSQGAFTLIEILFVCGLVAVLSVFVFASLSQFRIARAMEGGTQKIFSVMEEARTHTLASRNGRSYGVHLSTSTLVLFQGKEYSESHPANKKYDLASLLEITNVSLSGGGKTIVFDRFTGGTSDIGTFVLRVRGDSGRKTIFEVEGTGNVSRM